MVGLVRLEDSDDQSELNHIVGGHGEIVRVDIVTRNPGYCGSRHYGEEWAKDTLWAAREPKLAKIGRREMFWSMKKKSVKI
jgi:hypothetical protein